MSTLASSKRASGLRVSSAIAACTNRPRHAGQHVNLRSTYVQGPTVQASYVKLGCMRTEGLTEAPGQLVPSGRSVPLPEALSGTVCLHT
jgi:hypothetical protein